MKNFIRLLSEMNSQRYSRLINGLISKKIPCGFFTGFDAAQWKLDQALNLKNAGVNLQLVCVIDDDQRQKLQSKISIVTLKELETLPSKPQRMLYMSDWAFDEFFIRLGMQTMDFSDVRQLEAHYEFIYRHLDEIFEAYRLLDDEESRAAYRAYLKGSVTNRIGDYRFAPEPQYWLEPFTPVEGDISIDGGAFDGSTAIDFASRGAKVYSFELDQKNYQRCLPLAEKYHFTLENMGLYSEESVSDYVSAPQGNDAASRIIPTLLTGGEIMKAHLIDLDTYVNQKELPHVDHIKLDIEGAELDCLKGAAKSIIRWKPKMAISAYHRPEDLWTLVPYIRSLRSDYKFAFRHYRIDNRGGYSMSDEKSVVLKRYGLSLFLPTPYETVLYCK